MQVLNSQRKAFLDMVAWSEGTDNGRQPTRNHGYDVIVGGELFTDYSDHPRKLVTLNPKLKSTAAGRYQFLSRWWDAYRKQLGLKDFSPKSQDAVALQQIKVAVADDDCAARPVPAAAADRLRKYANSLREHSEDTTTSQLDF